MGTNQAQMCVLPLLFIETSISQTFGFDFPFRQLQREPSPSNKRTWRASLAPNLLRCSFWFSFATGTNSKQRLLPCGFSLNPPPKKKQQTRVPTFSLTPPKNKRSKQTSGTNSTPPHFGGKPSRRFADHREIRGPKDPSLASSRRWLSEAAMPGGRCSRRAWVGLDGAGRVGGSFQGG